MDKDIFNKAYYNKISRNGILENDKFDIIKKFGFSSFMSTSMQSRNKSFNEEKILKKETSNKIIFKHKSYVKNDKSTTKPILLKMKTVKKKQPIIKVDISIKKCNNIFSYAQKMDFKADKTDKKKNKISIISKSFLNSYSLKKYSSKNNNNNSFNKAVDNKKNKKKSKIKSILLNQSSLINSINRKKIESYEKIMNKNYKLKYKFLFGKNNFNDNNITKKYTDSNTISIISDENNMSTKREKYNKKILLFENNSNNKQGIEPDYNINDNYSSENISEKYNINKFDVIEPCKNFNTLEENLCDLDNDISEGRSNDNNLDKNSNLLSNMNNNNFTLIINKEKEKEFFDKYYLKNQYLFNKLSHLFINNDSCNISPRNDLNDFSKINNQTGLYEKKYKFISDIQKDTEKLPSLNIKSFLNLNDYCLYRLMGYMFDSSSFLIRTNSLIKSKIKNAFNNIFSDSINNFANLYSSFLKVINYYFENRKMIVNKKIMYTFNLIIICKIITKETNKSYNISYNYIYNNKEYDNLWKIDIKRKNNIKIWLHTELYKISKYSYNFTYTSQISTFSYGDEIKLEINIFNHKQQINPYSIQWLPPVITDIENNIFEANKFINKSPFDPLRCNEIELQVLIWEEISISNKNNALLNEFFNTFKRHFEIKNIYTYKAKHIFYKLKIIPNKKGILPKNKFLFFDLNIIDYDKPLQNEVQSIYLMNSNYYTKKMDIRLGTKVIFYITDYKG